MIIWVALLSVVFIACKNESNDTAVESLTIEATPLEPKIKYGFDYNQYDVKEFKIKRGDTFGAILERNGIDYPEVHNILQVIKKSEVNIRKLQIGKPYTLLFTKDSVPRAQAFIYQPGIESYDVVQLKDSLYANKVKKNIRVVELLSLIHI